MSANIKRPYGLFGKFVYRTPLFPYNTLDRFYHATCRDDYESFITDPYLKEAVFLASPDLYRQLELFLEGKLKSEDESNFKRSILKYLIRMCTRCTPFGLFAGCGVGNIAVTNGILLNEAAAFRAHTRLDMNYLCSLIQDIGRSEAVRGHIKYFLNSSLYLLGKSVRYTEYCYVRNRRKHILSSVEVSPYLLCILNKASNGADLKELQDALADFEVSEDESKEFIYELIDNQILVSELEPTVTGDDLLCRLVKSLQRIGINHPQLLNITGQLAHINASSIGREKKNYDSVISDLRALGREYSYKYLFQTDLLITSTNANVSDDIAESIFEGIQVLNKLTPASGDPMLRRFKEDFYKRYEHEEIPLLEALDPEIGIGFGTNGSGGDINVLIDDIVIQSKGTNEQSINLNAVHAFLSRKYDEYLRERSQGEIEITKEEIRHLKESWTDLPVTIYTLISTLGAAQDGDRHTIHLKAASGSSAANLLGRFCYMDNEIDQLVKDIVQKEDDLNPGAILAEIVHLPESRTGNILYRPTLRRHEITYLANFSAEPHDVIPVSDLKVSVANGKIRIRSERLNKQIIPRLTNAHAYSRNSTAVYHFLCALQMQDLRPFLIFDWGKLLASKPELPRVRYKKVILSPAIWNISAFEMKSLPHFDDMKFMDEVQSLKSRRHIPDKVLLVEHDNKLLINFNHLPSVQLLFSRRERNIRLEEFLFAEGYALISRGDEVFTNELVFALYKNME